MTTELFTAIWIAFEYGSISGFVDHFEFFQKTKQGQLIMSRSWRNNEVEERLNK